MHIDHDFAYNAPKTYFRLQCSKNIFPFTNIENHLSKDK